MCIYAFGTFLHSTVQLGVVSYVCPMVLLMDKISHVCKMRYANSFPNTSIALEQICSFRTSVNSRADCTIDREWWLAVRVEDEGFDHRDSKVYDMINRVNWNELPEIMEEVFGLKEKVNSVWDMLHLDAFETFFEVTKKVFEYIDLGLRDKIWVRDTDLEELLVYKG